MSKPVMIDSDNSERYIVLAAAKSVAGISLLFSHKRTTRAMRVFLCRCSGTPIFRAVVLIP